MRVDEAGEEKTIDDASAKACRDAKKAQPVLGNVCVVGLGTSGAAVARWCRRHLGDLVSGFTIYAGARTEKTYTAAKPFIEDGIDVYFDTEEVLGTFDVAVVSPGISNNSDFYKSAKRAARCVMSEPELAYRVSTNHWIAITGTNGKTTTTALVAHVLEECGLAAQAVGNIGDPCISAVDECGEDDYLVAELSSYQLASVTTFSPDVAVLLNITPDHLAWHGSHEAYTAAKMRLFDNLKDGALAVVDVVDHDASICARQLKRRGLHVLGIDVEARQSSADLATCIEGVLGLELSGSAYQSICPADALSIKGEHNTVNALAAAAAAYACGIPVDRIAAALCSFKPLEHRIEPVGQVDGVFYYNDSKATNTDAVQKALTAFIGKPLIVLLGGKDKGTDLSDLVADCTKSCKAVVCYGAARDRFLAAFAGAGIEVLAASNMADAIRAARACATVGDTILLSPACASFDEFDSFEQRGEVFKEHVVRMQGYRQ